MPLEEIDKQEVERIAEAARKRARVCPACKAEDAIFHNKCQECGAYLEGGVWKLPAPKSKQEAPKTEAPKTEPPKEEVEEWNPLKW